MKPRYTDLKKGETLRIIGVGVFNRNYDNLKIGINHLSADVRVFNFGNRGLGRRIHLRLEMTEEFIYEVKQ